MVSSSVGSSRVQPVDNNCKLLISPSACEEFAVSVVPLDTGGESIRLGLPEPTPLVVKSSHHDTFPSFWAFLLMCRICYVLEIFSQACVRSSKEKTLQEFREFLEDKSLDNSDLLRFYEQNMFEYKQGLAPPAVKGRLKGTHPVLGRYWGTSLGVREH